MSARKSALFLLPLILGLAAVGLRWLPARGFALGRVEFTPATFLALLAGLAAFLILIADRRGTASWLLQRDQLAGHPPAHRILVASLVGVAAVLRLAHLWEYPLNGDEHLFVNTASADGWAGLWRGILEHHHPPANFYLLHLMQRVSVAPLWLRIPSLVSGIYLVWITARLGRACGRPLEGLTLAALTAFSPALIELSRVCRNYAPAFALMMTALYFFVRFFQNRRTGDLLLFSFFESLALLWLYTLVIPFLAANLVLFGSLAMNRRPRHEWTRPFVVQLPVAGLMMLLYFAHIRIVSAAGMSDLIAERTIDRVLQSPLDHFHFLPLPVLLLYQYLLGGLAGLAMSLLALVGACQLWFTGRRWLFWLCILPFPISYAFGFTGMIPLGGNRQSSFLFPFAFLLVAGSVPAVLEGLASLRRRIPSATPPSSSPSGNGLLALAAVFALFFYLSLGIQEDVVFLDRQVELPTSYAELDRTLDMLASHAGPDDLILVSFQGMVAYHAYANRTAMPYHPAENFDFDVRGMRFHYSSEAGWFFSPASLIRAYADVAIREALSEVDRVWTVRGAGAPWEEAPRDWFNHDFPEVPKDDRIYLESQGWLFNVRAVELRKLLPRIVHDPAFYPSDFTRTQFSPEAHRSAAYYLDWLETDPAGD